MPGADSLFDQSVEAVLKKSLTTKRFLATLEDLKGLRWEPSLITKVYQYLYCFFHLTVPEPPLGEDFLLIRDVHLHERKREEYRALIFRAVEVGFVTEFERFFFERAWPQIFRDEDRDVEYLESDNAEAKDALEEWMERVKEEPFHFKGEF